MTQLKINEQISFLRKQKGMTQEGLAQALGVSNQAVSKWESAQCCPDIGLLPDIAKLFDVSIDELMGYKGTNTSKDLILQIRNKIDSAKTGEDYQYALQVVYATHATIFSKAMSAPGTGNPGWDTEDAIEHAGKSEWGLSCMNIPEITTIMLGGSVFFSNNNIPDMKVLRFSNLYRTLKDFSDLNSLKVLFSLYKLTLHDESSHVGISEISTESSLPTDTVRSCLENNLCTYLHEQTVNNIIAYRINGMFMHIVPLLIMLINQ
ncbi:MAG TPA: hypothetical protein DDZ89_20135 [Clostridiales bacterium]|nr:hypothetical protein [Clostridiales bacterium]